MGGVDLGEELGEQLLAAGLVLGCGVVVLGGLGGPELDTGLEGRLLPAAAGQCMLCDQRKRIQVRGKFIMN